MLTIVIVHTLQEFESMGYGRTLNIMGVFIIALFVVSGYGFRAKKLKKTFTQQIQLIVIPYIITSILTCIFHCICYVVVYGSKRAAVKETLKVFAGLALGLSDTVQVKGINLFSCGPMWYLWALFWVWIIMTIVFNYVPEKWRLPVVITITVVGIALNFVTFNPWCIYRGMLASIFVYIGYYCKKKKLITTKWETKYKVLLWASLVVAVMVFAFAGDNQLLHVVLFPLVIIYPPVFVKIFLALNNVFTGKISNKIRAIGRYSLYFLCVHSFEYIAVPWYYIAERVHSHLGVAILCVARLVMDIIICFGVVKIVPVIKNKLESSSNGSEPLKFKRQIG